MATSPPPTTPEAAINSAITTQANHDRPRRRVPVRDAGEDNAAGSNTRARNQVFVTQAARLVAGRDKGEPAATEGEVGAPVDIDTPCREVEVTGICGFSEQTAAPHKLTNEHDAARPVDEQIFDEELSRPRERASDPILSEQEVRPPVGQKLGKEHALVIGASDEQASVGQRERCVSELRRTWPASRPQRHHAAVTEPRVGRAVGPEAHNSGVVIVHLVALLVHAPPGHSRASQNEPAARQ